MRGSSLTSQFLKIAAGRTAQSMRSMGKICALVVNCSPAQLGLLHMLFKVVCIGLASLHVARGLLHNNA